MVSLCPESTGRTDNIKVKIMTNVSQESYRDLQEKFDAFQRQEITDAELKPHTAPLGIYMQRNGMFMVRIRVPGGHFPLAGWQAVAGIMAAHGVGYGHLSTRQDLQLHDVPPEQVHSIVMACCGKGMAFKGGGGDTFRNIAASSDSGLTAGEVFDVTPCVQALTKIIFDWSKAYKLPRKLKIGFAASPRDEAMAAIQDLGFVAAIVDGRAGFRVYGGGGMGNSSAFGVKLFDFIPVADVPRCAWAMTELFSEHGDRQHRNQARIRFIVARVGEAEFVRLFQSYYDRAPADYAGFPDWSCDLAAEAAQLKTVPSEPGEPDGYGDWLKTAVTPTRFGDRVVTVRLRVSGGHLTAAQVDKIAALTECCGDSFIRLTPSQDILLPLVRREALPMVYQYLTDDIGEVDLTVKSLVGQVICCVGSSVCKIGVLDAPAAADAIGRCLDEYFLENPELKAELTGPILDAIRISGCPNSCSGHPAAAIGLQGMKRKFDAEPEPAYRFFRRTGDNAFALSVAEEEAIPATGVPARVMQLLRERGLLR